MKRCFSDGYVAVSGETTVCEYYMDDVYSYAGVVDVSGTVRLRLYGGPQLRLILDEEYSDETVAFYPVLLAGPSKLTVYSEEGASVWYRIIVVPLSQYMLVYGLLQGLL